MSSIFFDAIKQGNLQETERLISADKNLIRQKEAGLSPMMIAAYWQQPEIADFLADKAGKLNAFEAAATGRINQLAIQLARDPLLVNAYTEDGYQLLGIACLCGQRETAEFLIKAGASINTPSRNEQKAAPLQLAVEHNHLKIVTLLLDNNADPNALEQNGCTPLHAAAQNGNQEIIRALLFNGANLAIRDQNNKLPIDMAIEAGHKEAAGLLKEGITRRFRTFKRLGL